MKRPPLWAWGLALIAGGVLAGAVLGPPKGGSMEARGEAFGRGVTQLAVILAGVVLIVVHFLRRPGKKG